SARFSSADSRAVRAEKTTLPLPNTVATSVKSAASNARLSAGILQFVGITPRRNATYRGIRLQSISRCSVNGRSNPRAAYRSRPKTACLQMPSRAARATLAQHFVYRERDARGQVE